MKLPLAALTIGLAVGPQVNAWGSIGHITTAYLASRFVANSTEHYLQQLLQNNSQDYLAKVATWADSVRYTNWGRFTKTFHFIDAHDDPPRSCTVDLARDCKQTGCVVSALANYTLQMLDDSLPKWRRAQAAKFVVHFIGDLHQPLHNEDVGRGGNSIKVLWDGKRLNLHQVWDSSIVEKSIRRLRGPPYSMARNWADQLAAELTDGKFADEKQLWLKDIDLQNVNHTALAWASEANALVCSHVLPQGPEAIVDQELGGRYFDEAAPVVEKQVARGGYRLAAWLDGITEELEQQRVRGPISHEL